MYKIASTISRRVHVRGRPRVLSSAVEVAQLAPIVYHSGRLGRLVCSHQQVYPTIFKTLSYIKLSDQLELNISATASFLSIGHHTCRWLHVMEHESFEKETAEFVNKFEESSLLF